MWFLESYLFSDFQTKMVKILHTISDQNDSKKYTFSGHAIT